SFESRSSRRISSFGLTLPPLRTKQPLLLRLVTSASCCPRSPSQRARRFTFARGARRRSFVGTRLLLATGLGGTFFVFSGSAGAAAGLVASPAKGQPASPCFESRCVRASQSSGKNFLSRVVCKYPTPSEPPVPRFVPTMRSTILM